MTSETPTETIGLEIRQRRPDELPVEVEIYNDAFPPDWHSTVDEMRAWENLQQKDDDVLRLLAFSDGVAAGAGRAFHSPHSVAGRFEIEVAVRPAFRRQGIGKALYHRLVSFASDHGAKELESGVRVTLLQPVESWLAHEGFAEVSRMRESQLDISSVGSTVEADAQDRAKAAGVTLTTLAAVESEEARRRLWKLSQITDRDIPFDTPHADEPFERFEAMIGSPLCMHDCLVIATVGKEFVGFTITAKQTDERAFTWATGVHPDYRGRGISRAMKLRASVLAHEKGFQAMRTFNHTNNPAMLSVNVGMGYRPLPEVIFFVKRLPSEAEPSQA